MPPLMDLGSMLQTTEKNNNYKIFVMIPSLFDPSIKTTMLDCINKAANPDDITFGVSLQGLEDIDLSDIPNEKRIVTLPSNIVYGIGKTRYHIQQLYNDEDFILSIDCHTVFDEEWDTKLINDYLSINDDHAVISQFLHSMPSESIIKSEYEYSKIDAWAMKYIVSQTYNKLDEIRLTQRIAPHFIFSNKNFMKIDYPYKYIWGDEDHILSIKLFCNGFNMYELPRTYMGTIAKDAQACIDRSEWFFSAMQRYDDNSVNITFVEPETVFGAESAIKYNHDNIDLSNHLFYPGTKTRINQQREAALLIENSYSLILLEDFRNTERTIKDYFEFHGISWEQVLESTCNSKKLGVQYYYDNDKH
jgi:hypothetical protein